MKSFSSLVSVLREDFLFGVGLFLIGILLLIAVAGPLLAPFPGDAYGDIHLNERLLPPSTSHLLGTDVLGRDIFSQLLLGARIELVAGFVVVGLSILLGVPFGLISGFKGGRVGEIIMRLADTFLSFPFLVLPLFLSALFGTGLFVIAIALSLNWWPWYARVIRSQVISVKESQYVEATRVMGAGQAWIIRKHVLPNSISPIIVQASMDMGYAILAVSALSFLGMGAEPPTPEWGVMLSSARPYFMDFWWTMFFPGLAIFVAVLGFNLLGDGARDIMDPRGYHA